MRRLPIFFLIDVSESMAGENIYETQEAIKAILSNLRKEPSALESVYISVIVFAGKAKTLSPLTEIAAFVPPQLPLGGGTALGRGLEHLMDEIDRNVVKGSSDRKGDWRPLIFLLTDGRPTHDAQKAIDRWNRDFRNKSTLVAVSIGGQADHQKLSALTNDVVVFMDAAPDAFAKFVKWISNSISSQSRSVATGKEEQVAMPREDEGDFLVPLDKAPSEITRATTGVDERIVIAIGKCERTKHPYLLKYELASRSNHQYAHLVPPGEYIISAGVPLTEAYFELTDNESEGSTTTDMTKLHGGTSCPHCAATYAMAIDGSCQNIHCVDGPGLHRCPWCGNTDNYGEIEEGTSNIQMRRGRG